MRRKWKVIIVDDEYYIGQLIGKLLPWDQYGLVNEGIFDNSEEALEKILTDTPDIVITDIRMPQISGLDLIRKTFQNGKKVKFIITSGYREFDYAQQAMKYGVDNYILKPVRKENLEEAVSHVCSLLEKDAHVEDIEQEISRVSSQQTRRRKNDLLRNAVEQAGTGRYDLSELAVDGDGYLGMDIKLDYIDVEKNAGNQEEAVTRNILRLADEKLGEVCDDVLCYPARNLHLIVLMIAGKEKDRKLREQIESLLSESSQYLLNSDFYHVTFGIGQVKESTSMIPDTIREAREAVSGRYAYGTERTLVYRDMPLYQKNAASEILGRHRMDIARAAETFDKDLLAKEVERSFHEFWKGELPNMKQLFDLASVIISYFQECVGAEQPQAERQTIMDRLDLCADKVQFVKAISDSLGDLLEQKKQASESQNMKPIRIAKAYMEEHYDQKLTLEDIAQQAALSPIYLGTLFKKETGQTIGSYLTSLRMEKAKKLLLETNDTVAAIGAKVGYRDQKYFSQTFTKYVGIKPNLYRKLHA